MVAIARRVVKRQKRAKVTWPRMERTERRRVEKA